MPNYRVYYLKEELSRRMAEVPPGNVRRQLRQREYALVKEMDAPHEYAAWQALQQQSELPRRFSVGDVLESDGKLRLCLYGGFEDAAWEMRDPKPPGSQPDPPPGQPADFPVDQPPITPPPQPGPGFPPREPNPNPPVEEPPRNEPPD